jgi:chaperonin GroEL (HSP60 family)
LGTALSRLRKGETREKRREAKAVMRLAAATREMPGTVLAAQSSTDTAEIQMQVRRSHEARTVTPRCRVVVAVRGLAKLF